MNFDFLKIGRKRGFYPNYFGKLGNLHLERKGMELWCWKSLEITSLHIKIFLNPSFTSTKLSAGLGGKPLLLKYMSLSFPATKSYRVPGNILDLFNPPNSDFHRDPPPLKIREEPAFPVLLF